MPLKVSLLFMLFVTATLSGNTLHLASAQITQQCGVSSNLLLPHAFREIDMHLFHGLESIKGVSFDGIKSGRQMFYVQNARKGNSELAGEDTLKLIKAFNKDEAFIRLSDAPVNHYERYAAFMSESTPEHVMVMSRQTNTAFLDFDGNEKRLYLTLEQTIASDFTQQWNEAHQACEAAISSGVRNHYLLRVAILLVIGVLLFRLVKRSNP
jgi:hypothetical protein